MNGLQRWAHRTRNLLERAGYGRRVNAWMLVGAILVPILVAAGSLWATWNADDRLRSVQAAVVNLDEPANLNGQLVPLGRQLTAKLVDSEKQRNLTWVLADASSAQAGLDSGRYAAVITIPANFSKAATSYATSADAAHQATIDIQTSQITGIVDAPLAQNIANAAAEALNSMLTKSYLNNVYLGFNKTGAQFQTVADAADKLADGGASLASGATKAASGATQLDEGLRRLTTAGTPLSTGGTTLADGGATLARGVDTYTNGVSTLSTGVASYAAGVATYAKGVDTYADAIDATAGPLLPYLRQLPNTIVDVRQAAKDARTFSDTVNTVKANGATLKADLKRANATVQQYTGEVVTYVQFVTAVADGTRTVLCPDSVQAQYGAAGCGGYEAGARQLAQTAVAPLQAHGGQRSVVQESKDVAAQSQKAYDTLVPLVAHTATVAKVADEVADNLENLAATTPTLSTKQLKAQVSQLLTAPRALADGAQQLNGGAAKLATGTKRLAAGGEALDQGAAKYAAGVRTYTDGVTQYTSGVGQAAGGASTLASGLNTLAQGSDKLADGQRSLADGLKKGATQVPSYSKSDRENLAKVVAEPLSTANLDDLVTPRVSWASLLMVVALWLGALSTYVLFKALSTRLMLSGASTPKLVVRALAPGLSIVGVQALAVTAIGQVALHLPWTTVGAVFAFLLLAAVAFVGVNQALVAWFKGAGRLVSVAFAVLTFASALTYALPSFLATARHLSPLSPALDGVRALMTGGSALTGSILALLGWAALGVGGTLAAVVRARQVRPADLLARHTG